MVQVMIKKKFWNQTRAMTSLIVMASFFSGAVIAQSKQENNTVDLVGDIPLEEIRVFVDVYMQIKQRYVDEISDKELIEKAINGMVEGLDPYSEYLGSTTFEHLTSDTKGQFGGVGVQISINPEGIYVNRPIENSPATDVDIQVTRVMG